jgi:FeS assembly protein IscX
MKLKWGDSLAIAITLDDAHPQVDPRQVDLKQLHRWVCALREFDDNPEPVGKDLLEAIKKDWIEERE